MYWRPKDKTYVITDFDGIYRCPAVFKMKAGFLVLYDPVKKTYVPRSDWKDETPKNRCAYLLGTDPE